MLSHGGILENLSNFLVINIIKLNGRYKNIYHVSVE